MQSETRKWWINLLWAVPLLLVAIWQASAIVNYEPVILQGLTIFIAVGWLTADYRASRLNDRLNKLEKKLASPA